MDTQWSEVTLADGTFRTTTTVKRDRVSRFIKDARDQGMTVVTVVHGVDHYSQRNVDGTGY